jgi:heme-degrading monooxygenase HmoA
MHATMRRYDGIDPSRRDELIKKVDETFVPRLSEMPGFNGYYLIEAGNGVMSSISFWDSSEQSDESTRIAATWVRDEKLETALPNPPKVTEGEVVFQKELVRA